METEIGFVFSKLVSGHMTQTRHLALVMVLIHLTFENSSKKRLRASRKQLMTLSRIKSITTYHKTVEELCAMGVIRYYPSFHPQISTEIELLGLD